MRHGFGLLALGLVLGVLAGPAGAWYPNTAQVEFCTSTT
jgi:hypothetical protein